MVVKKPTTSTKAVKSVTLDDVKAAGGATGVKTIQASGTEEAKQLDKDVKDLDREEKTASIKELDKSVKETDKYDKLANP